MRTPTAIRDPAVSLIYLTKIVNTSPSVGGDSWAGPTERFLESQFAEQKLRVNAIPSASNLEELGRCLAISPIGGSKPV